MTSNKANASQEPPDNPLECLILEIIREEGPISFCRFMELALYHPQFGYYSSSPPSIGKRGDYVTSPELSPVFGALLAMEFRRRWEKLKQPASFHLIELGAGTGTLAKSILETISERWPDWLENVSYQVIERSEHLISQQREALTAFKDNLVWISEEEFREANEQIVGCVFSNEFFDALPVHLVEQRDRMLREIYVATQRGQLSEMLGPLSDPRLSEYFQDVGVELREGQRTTVNLAALDWVTSIGQSLKGGFHLLVDYGYEAKDLHHPHHPHTLLCHYQHTTNDAFFQRIGEQDITAHVDFTSLRQVGDQVGLRTVDFLPQWKFLLELGWMEAYQTFMEAKGEAAPAMPEAQGMKQLIWPGGMGDIFKVLIQKKISGTGS